MENELQLQWETIRQLRNRLLAETDYLAVRAYESGTSLPPEIRQYRQALRDIPEVFSNPADVAWPDLPITST